MRKDCDEAKFIKKIWNLKKKFFPIFPTPGVEQPTPTVQLRGEVSKIAPMRPNNFPWGPLMPNLKSLLCSVWAVGGGGGYEKPAAHLINGGNLYVIESKRPRPNGPFRFLPILSKIFFFPYYIYLTSSFTRCYWKKWTIDIQSPYQKWTSYPRAQEFCGKKNPYQECYAIMAMWRFFRYMY